MKAKFFMDDALMDKIDEVKKRLGIEDTNYVNSIGLICDIILEVMEKYENNMEFMFRLLMEYRSDLVYENSPLLNECLDT